jgi:sodium transport system permease protein
MSDLMPKGAVWPWWRRCGVVLRKEVVDHLRDRRSIALALIYPLLGPLVVGLLLQLSAESQRGVHITHEITVAARGLDRVPELASFLALNQVELVASWGGEAQGPGKRGRVVLDVPADATPHGPFTVRVLFDANNVTETAIAGRVTELINSYGRQLERQSLVAHGLDPALIQPVTVERVHTGHRLDLSSVLYNLIPPLLIFMIFLGAVYLALDSTVGERERGTLEPLLTAPIRRWELLLGKAGAAFLFTLATVIFNLAAFRLVLGLCSGGALGSEAAPGSGTFLLILVLSLPVMVLAVMVQLVVAAIARTLKEAQIYLGLLPLVPALPGIASAVAPAEPHLWMSSMPVFGQMTTFIRLIAGAPVSWLQVVLSAVITLVSAVLVFWWAARLYEQDRTLIAD